MTKLIGICGYMQHGKDSTAKLLMEEFGYHRLALADKLREIALAIDPYISLASLPTGKMPYEEIYAMATHAAEVVRLSILVQMVGWEKAKKHPDVRRFLQRLGTEGMREIVSDTFWIDLHWQYASSHGKVTVPDVRFPNEGDYIHSKGGVLIRIHDPRKPVNTSHASEQFIEKLPHDYLLLNDGSIPDLYEKVRKVMKEIEGQ